MAWIWGGGGGSRLMKGPWVFYFLFFLVDFSEHKQKTKKNPTIFHKYDSFLCYSAVPRCHVEYPLKMRDAVVLGKGQLMWRAEATG